MDALRLLGLLPKYPFSLSKPSTRPLLSHCITSNYPNSISIKPSTVCFSTKWTERLFGDFNSSNSTTVSPITSDNGSDGSITAVLSLIPSSSDRTLPLPIDFYKVLGVETHTLSDGIKRAFEARISKRPKYGFSPDALIGRRQILDAAFNVLSDPPTRFEYTQGIFEDRDANILVDLTWDKVPGALCVLQEAGENELVLETGTGLLKEKLPKNFKQDIVLAMALAYVDLSRDAMWREPPDIVTCCEVLERALKLLQEEGATNLAPDLISQIDETLDEMSPRCVIELLSLPLNPVHHTKREEGLRGARNILWNSSVVGGGFTRQGFMNESLLCMTSSEQIELFTTTPSNIPPDQYEVYGVALAYVAQAVAFKKPNFILRADALLGQLQNPNPNLEEIPDFTLERGLCALLIGDLDKCRKWLGLDAESSNYRDPEVINFIIESSNLNANKEEGMNENEGFNGDLDLLPGLCKLLETWLLQVVFPRCRDTRALNCNFRLGDYYDDPVVLGFLESIEGGAGAHLTAVALALGTVKSKTLNAFQKVFPVIMKESEGGNEKNEGTVGKDGDFEELERLKDDFFGVYMKDKTVKIVSAGVAVFLLVILGNKFLHRKGRFYPLVKNRTVPVIDANVVNSLDEDVRKDEGMDEREVVPMDVKLAEIIVRKWQSIKALAMGPTHSQEPLKEILDGRMLKVWTERATEMAARGWYWNYNPLNISIDNLTVSLDGRHAIVEATIKESANLINGDHDDEGEKVSSYCTRYEMEWSDSGWKILDGAMLFSSQEDDNVERSVYS